MHLLFDARHINPKIDGLARYVINLLNNLPESDNKISLLCKPQIDTKLFACPEKFQFLETQIPSNAPLQNLNFLNKFKNFKPDVYFNPFIDGPLCSPIKKNIFAIHDLNHYFFSPFAATERKYAILYAKFAINMMAKTYDRTIVFSNFVKKQVIDKTLVKENKISTIYHGFEKFGDDEIMSPTSDSKYILYVGNNRPHKNLKNLLDGFQQSSLPDNGYKLVLAGNQISRFFNIEDYIVNNNLRSVEFINYPNDVMLGELYKNCFAVVYPSVSEGFGFPLLETWHYKKPILCSNTSCLPEIGGDGALYFNPFSQESIANALNDIIHNKNLRESIIKTGETQLLKYSWTKSGKEHFNVFFEEN